MQVAWLPSDASLANRENNSSQLGYVVLLCDANNNLMCSECLHVAYGSTQTLCCLIKPSCENPGCHIADLRSRAARVSTAIADFATLLLFVDGLDRIRHHAAGIVVCIADYGVALP